MSHLTRNIMPGPSSLPDLTRCRKIGFIVPSSNSVVEPTCNAIVQDLNAQSPDAAPVVCLYTRIRVKTVGTDSASTSQFSTEALVAAAQLLADAECEAILWNGTSGMWVGTGLGADEALAKAMTNATGIPCSTTTLATIHALRSKSYKTISLAVPYSAPLTQICVDFFTGCGFEVLSAERQEPTPTSNLEIGKSSTEAVKDVIISAAGDLREDACPDAVVVACTNWPGAGLAESLGNVIDVQATVVDSVTVTVWEALRMIGWEGSVSGWGDLMAKL